MTGAPDDAGTAKPGVFFADEAGSPDGPDPETYRAAERLAIEALAGLDPAVQAARCGARVVDTPGLGTRLELEFCGQSLQVDISRGRVAGPGGIEPPVWERIPVLHYLAGTVTPVAAGEWISFQQLPDGAFYFEAFRKRTHVPLANAFGDRPEGLISAGATLGGEIDELGDASVIVHAFPKVPVAAVVYSGDEEFPADAKLLFDVSIPAYLNAEDIAVLGGIVVGKLIQARGECAPA